jgi:hypothetical protein
MVITRYPRTPPHGRVRGFCLELRAVALHDHGQVSSTSDPGTDCATKDTRLVTDDDCVGDVLPNGCIKVDRDVVGDRDRVVRRHNPCPGDDVGCRIIAMVARSGRKGSDIHSSERGKAVSDILVRANRSGFC